MQKVTACGLFGAALFTFISAGCFIGNGSLSEKHTGPIKVRNEAMRQEGMFEFARANGEIFEMAFDPHYLGPQIHKGDSLGDLIYTDTKDHHEFFVKAILLAEAPPPEVSTEVLYKSEGGSYSCTGNGECRTYFGTSVPMFRWADGGYHEKPDPKKAK